MHLPGVLFRGFFLLCHPSVLDTNGYRGSFLFVYVFKCKTRVLNHDIYIPVREL